MKPSDCLRKVLSNEEMSIVPKSFDVVGDILIFSDMPESKKQKLIARCFLDSLKNVNVVCRKSGQYSGVYRTPKLTILAGEKRKETVHRENNVSIKLDVEKCYFSPRLATERKRIASLVKPGEKVLVMFSGVAPYPLVIAKNSKPKLVVGIEKNPVAHRYAVENIMLNKIPCISLFKGDVKKVLPTLRQNFDRVLMPLPKSAEDFLCLAILKVKRNRVLHFYDFLPESEFCVAKEKVQSACKKLKRKCKILKVVKCGQFSPRVFRVCVDAVIE
ncbi:MAG: class I SAM-dependent methyltransferase family protein [Candidatus Woesearchaeota archaeon]